MMTVELRIIQTGMMAAAESFPLLADWEGLTLADTGEGRMLSAVLSSLTSSICCSSTAESRPVFSIPLVAIVVDVAGRSKGCAVWRSDRVSAVLESMRNSRKGID